MLNARRFGLSRNGVDCDESGLRVGGVALLSRDRHDNWAPRNASELSRELSEIYGFPVVINSKLTGMGAIGQALHRGNLARAQIAALLLQIPDPPPRRSLSKLERQRLSDDLAVCKLLDIEHLETRADANISWTPISSSKSQK